MSQAQQIRRYTPEEYYRLEVQAEHRSAFYQGEIFATAGGSARQGQIATNIIGQSLKVILLVSQDEARVEEHVRQLDGSWNLREFVGIENTLTLAAIGVQLPLAAIYQGVDFTSAE